jgi:hypothetical protein
MASYSDEPVSDEEFQRQLKERKQQQKTNKAAEEASKRMASGGSASDAMAKASAKRSVIESSWKTPKAPEPVKMAKGGSASRRADGIASKGKTRGTIVAMCCGGKAKK